MAGDGICSINGFVATCLSSMQVRRRMPFIFLCVWVLPFLTHFYMPLLNEVIDGSCLIWYNVQTVLHRILILTNALIWFCLIPSITIIILYTRMGFAIKFRFPTLNDVNDNSKIARLAQRNIFSTCSIMVVAFLVCWSLYVGTIIAASGATGYIMDSLNGDVFYVADLLLEVNSSINPIIYAFR